MSDNTRSVCDTHMTIEPSGSIFNVETDELEQFMIKTLNNRGITGVKDVEISFTDHKVLVFVFLHGNSNALEKSRTNAPKRVLHRIEGVNKIYLTQETKELLADLLAYQFLSGWEKNEFYIELDIFGCLGYALAAPPNAYKIRISEFGRRAADGKNVIVVTKQDVKSIYSSRHNNDDRHSKLIERLERNRY